MPTRPDSRRLPLPLLGLALLTGAFTGIGVAVLELVAGELLLDSTLARSTPIVVVAPVLGIALAGVALRRLGRGASPANADAFLDAVRRGEELPAEPVAGRTIAATVTLGFGGALGFEGPSFYLGAAIGSAVRRHFSRFARPGDDRALLVAGAAAGVAAILRAPLTGIAFALEAPAHRGPRRPLLVPTAVASVIAWLTFASIFGFDPILPTTGTAALGPRIWFGASVTGLAAGIGARAFAAAVRRAKHLPGRFTPRRRLLVGGTLVVAVNTVAVAVLGGPLTVGVGYSVLDWSTAVRRSLGLLLALLVLRALATTLNLAAGGVGGVFIPLLVEGWILGAAVAVIVDDRSLILPVVGAAAFLAAGYHVPLSAVLLVLEASWHPEYVLPAVLAVTVARATVGSRSVSDAQRPLGPGPEDPAPAPE